LIQAGRARQFIVVQSVRADACDADRACGVAIRRMQAAFSGSNLKLDPYFRCLRARILKYAPGRWAL
jgi:hypothetical protein